MNNKRIQHLWWAVLVFATLMGAAFSAVSTHDFIIHLDRQTHAITCGFIPGIGTPDVQGSSGCFATMMSPYSSVMRDYTWGGIPIALPSLGVFAYLVFLGIDFWRRRQKRLGDLRYLIAATAFPVLVSIVYLYISLTQVGSLCKNCIGIYVSSILALVAAIALYIVERRAAAEAAAEAEMAGTRERHPGPVSWLQYVRLFVEGVVFVFLPVIIFLGAKPAYTDEIARCGELLHPEDKYGALITLNRGAAGSAPAITLVDPLCPVCKVFHHRLEESGLLEKLDLQGALFPLDKECNWMISESLHPGACAVSEAVICSKDNPLPILYWAFENQESLLEQAKANPKSIYGLIEREFPSLVGCVNKPAVKSMINKSLRWIVSNSAEVVVPQLFIGGQKMCSEDLDLGMEFSVQRMIDIARNPERKKMGGAR